MPVVLIPPARHGRALALYGLKRYAEARDEWVALLASNPPRPLAGEATFWLGDTLGRLGDEKGAVSRLKAFTAGGPQPLTENALLSLGWWSRAAGQPADAVQAYRALLSAYPQSASAPWARAGLVLALLDQNDFTAAREEAKRLEASSKTSPLVLPTLLSLRRWAADKGKVEEGQALDTDLLARTLEPETRAWVLLLSGELARQAGNVGEARDRLELVRSTAAGGARHRAAGRAATGPDRLRRARVCAGPDGRPGPAQPAARRRRARRGAAPRRRVGVLGAQLGPGRDVLFALRLRFPEAAGGPRGRLRARLGRVQARPARRGAGALGRVRPRGARRSARGRSAAARRGARRQGGRSRPGAGHARSSGRPVPGHRAGRGGPAQPRDPLAQCRPRDRCPGRAEPGRRREARRRRLPTSAARAWPRAWPSSRASSPRRPSRS